MDRVIVYVDDATYARQVLGPLTARAEANGTQWTLVACAPRMTHRISKWVSHSARENWRAKWADKLFAQVLPWLHTEGAQVRTVLAKGPLPELLAQLEAEHGAPTRVVDARRPKQAQEDTVALAVPVVVKKPARRWALPNTLASLFAAMVLVAD